MIGILRCVALIASLIVMGGNSAEAQQPRTRIAVVVKGQTGLVTFGQITAANPTDQYIVLLLGSGVAQLNVADSNAEGEFPGDTIRATGNLYTVFPATISETAVSPATISEPLLVSLLGLLIVDVDYPAAVNPEPLSYLIRVNY